uniref:Uncharacterized protein n=1 Tax=candidate division WOR-3 bacterium TaxID=2052148 RepID=A0A7C2NYM5_UNCW3
MKFERILWYLITRCKKGYFDPSRKKRDFERVAEIICKKIVDENLPDGFKLSRETERAEGLGLAD